MITPAVLKNSVTAKLLYLPGWLWRREEVLNKTLYRKIVDNLWRSWPSSNASGVVIHAPVFYVSECKTMTYLTFFINKTFVVHLCLPDVWLDFSSWCGERNKVRVKELPFVHWTRFLFELFGFNNMPVLSGCFPSSFKSSW